MRGTGNVWAMQVNIARDLEQSKCSERPGQGSSWGYKASASFQGLTYTDVHAPTEGKARIALEAWGGLNMISFIKIPT